MAATLAASFSANSLELAAGIEGGTYDSYVASTCSYYSKAANEKCSVKNMNGSIEIIEAIKSGEVDGGMVQADAIDMYHLGAEFKDQKAHIEYVFWIANKKLGITNLSDLSSQDEYVVVLIDDSGADITLKNFAREDDTYDIVYKNAVLAEDELSAGRIAANGKARGKKVAGLLYVGGSIPTMFNQYFGDKLIVGSASDFDFNDVTDRHQAKLYHNEEITSDITGGLSTVGMFSDPDTVAMSAYMVWKSPEDKTKKKALDLAVAKALRSAN